MHGNCVKRNVWKKICFILMGFGFFVSRAVP